MLWTISKDGLMVIKYNTTNIQSGRQQYLSLKLNSQIPNQMSWIVKMWHFGQDALTTYSGEKFNELGEYLECISSHLFQRVWKKENEG